MMSPHLEETGWDGPVFRHVTPELTILIFAGDGADLGSLDNVDIELRLPDGSAWSATVLTLGEVARLMDLWTQTGEALNGAYFACSDPLIIRRPGLSSIVDTLTDLHSLGEFTGVLRSLTSE